MSTSLSYLRMPRRQYGETTSCQHLANIFHGVANEASTLRPSQPGPAPFLAAASQGALLIRVGGVGGGAAVDGGTAQVTRRQRQAGGRQRGVRRADGLRAAQERRGDALESTSCHAAAAAHTGRLRSVGARALLAQ